VERKTQFGCALKPSTIVVVGIKFLLVFWSGCKSFKYSEFLGSLSTLWTSVEKFGSVLLVGSR
jgi:hypothetical protein